MIVLRILIRILSLDVPDSCPSSGRYLLCHVDDYRPGDGRKLSSTSSPSNRKLNEHPGFNADTASFVSDTDGCLALSVHQQMRDCSQSLKEARARYVTVLVHLSLATVTSAKLGAHERTGYRRVIDHPAAKSSVRQDTKLICRYGRTSTIAIDLVNIPANAAADMDVVGYTVTVSQFGPSRGSFAISCKIRTYVGGLLVAIYTLDNMTIMLYLDPRLVPTYK